MRTSSEKLKMINKSQSESVTVAHAMGEIWLSCKICSGPGFVTY